MITKDKNGEIFLNLEIAEVVIVYCNIVNNDYQQDLRVLQTFVIKKSFGKLLHISSKNVMFLKTLKPEFSYIETLFTHQKSKPTEIERRENKHYFIY